MNQLTKSLLLAAVRKRDDSSGRWVTLDPSGTHVFLDNSGRITAGPRALTGRPINNLRSSKPSSSGGPVNRLGGNNLSRDEDEPAKPKPQEAKPKPLKPSRAENEPKVADDGLSQRGGQPLADNSPGGNEHEPAAADQGGAGAGSSRRGDGEADRGRPAEAGGRLAEEAGGPADQGAGGERGNNYQPPDKAAPRRVPERVDKVMGRLDRVGRLLRSRGLGEAADWMEMVKRHVDSVGVEAALESLGPDVEGAGEDVQYAGSSEDVSDFARNYLDRVGISVASSSGGYDPGSRVISTVSATSDEDGFASRGDERDVFPQLQTLRNKLEESQNLPGLEKSKDLGELMGKGFGAKLTNFTPAVKQKLDEEYGEGKWIVKSYGDEAYAGYGIFFPQRVEQLQRDAQNALWSAGENLARYGFQLHRGEDGRVDGLVHEGGDFYEFGSEKYDRTINGDAREWGDKAAAAAPSESGAAIPEGSFMAQPAFPVVGISNEERAQGVTFKRGQEGRTHVYTKNGKAYLIPHSTWLKMEPLPVVFEDDDTKAMAAAALKAIEALPESERNGQLYAPDIVKTENGYEVVEANPANEAGASGYLQDNPFIIDSYVSHVTGREPEHVRFVKQLLSRRNRARKALRRSVTKALHKSLIYAVRAKGGLRVSGIRYNKG